MSLAVSLLGPPRIGSGQDRLREVPGLPGELLGLLAVLPGERASRDAIGDRLWPDGVPDRNRRNLSTTLWRLRVLVGDEARQDVVMTYPGGFLGLNRRSGIQCDVHELECALDRVSVLAPECVSETDHDRLRRAAALYRGEFLEGVMSEWILPHRDRLDRIYQECLVRLMKISIANSEFDESAYWAERILEQDPFREDVHRSLIEVYDQAGRRTDAVRHYDRMRQLMADELHTSPSPETESLFYRVIGTTMPEDRSAQSSRDHVSAGPSPRAADAEQGLGAVLHGLANVERLLAENLELLADYLDLSRH